MHMCPDNPAGTHLSPSSFRMSFHAPSIRETRFWFRSSRRIKLTRNLPRSADAGEREYVCPGDLLRAKLQEKRHMNARDGSCHRHDRIGMKLLDISTALMKFVHLLDELGQGRHRYLFVRDRTMRDVRRLRKRFHKKALICLMQ